MANKKFSDFTSKTSPSDVSFVVGYDGSDNVRISIANMNSAYLPLAGGTMTGNTIHGDNVKAIFGSPGNDLSIYHNGSNSFISDTGTGLLVISTNTLQVYNAAIDEFMITATENGSVDLYYDNSKKFETTSTGVSVTGNANFADDGKAIFGSPGNDLAIYHDGSNSYIQDTSGTGDLIIDTSAFRLRSANGGESMITAFEDGAVNIMHNNITRLTTTSTGISVTGNANFADNGKALFGDSDDLEIYHDSSDSFYNNTTGDMYFINKADDKDIIFQTDNGSGGYTAYLTLDGSTTHSYFSAGNLGIGTTAPTEKLSVTGGNIAIDNGSNYILGGATSGNAIIGRIKSTAGVYTVDGEGTRSIRLGSATNGEVARIDNTNGRVGIGTDAPTAKLQVVGLAEHADNSAATTAGLTAGAFYRTGDLLKVVH